MLTLLRAEAPPVRLVLEGAGGRGGLSEWRLLNATPAALWLLFVETSTEGQRTVLPEDNFAEAPRIEAGETFVFALGAARSARLERLLVLGFESPPQGHVSQLFDPLDALEQLQPRAVATLEVRREG